MPRCKACNAVLPDPNEKAHRRRKFCNAACKQRFYRKHRSERKREEHPPFYKEQAEYWQARYEDTHQKLERERRNGDEREKRLALLQERMDGLQEQREWIETRLPHPDTKTVRANSIALLQLLRPQDEDPASQEP